MCQWVKMKILSFLRKSVFMRVSEENDTEI